MALSFKETIALEKLKQAHKIELLKETRINMKLEHAYKMERLTVLERIGPIPNYS